MNINSAAETINLLLLSLFIKKLGNGRSINYWTDLWYRNDSLDKRFSRVALLKKDRGCTVVDRVEINTEENVPDGIGEGREQSQLAKLQIIRAHLRLNEEEDRWIWNLDPSREYTVASFRRAFDDMYLRRCGTITVWNKIVSAKIRVHYWRPMLDRLPTLDNLAKRGINFDNYMCVLCHGHAETSV